MDRVATIMSPRVVAIHADCDLSVAVDTFLRFPIRHLVVVDADRSVRGILTSEQVMVAMGTSGPRRVGDQALTPARGVCRDDDIADAAELMLQEVADAVLVTDGTGR